MLNNNKNGEAGKREGSERKRKAVAEPEESGTREAMGSLQPYHPERAGSGLVSTKMGETMGTVNGVITIF